MLINTKNVDTPENYKETALQPGDYLIIIKHINLFGRHQVLLGRKMGGDLFPLLFPTALIASYNLQPEYPSRTPPPGYAHVRYTKRPKDDVIPLIVDAQIKQANLKPRPMTNGELELTKELPGDDKYFYFRLFLKPEDNFYLKREESYFILQ